MMYSKKVIEHFIHPKNMGRIKNPDGVGKAGNPLCGDIMSIYIKVKDNRINNIKFSTMGCAVAIAASSIVTELARGRTLKKAQKITSQDITKKLGKVPVIKTHCSYLATQALRLAIEDYQKKLKTKN